MACIRWLDGSMVDDDDEKGVWYRKRHMEKLA